MQNRREIIKKIGLGTVWSTPVISTAILPAHAQTSVTTTPATMSYFLFDLPGTFCVEITGDMATVTMQRFANNVRRAGTFQINGSGGSGEVVEIARSSVVSCQNTPVRNLNVTLSNISDDSVDVMFQGQEQGGSFSVTVPAAPFCGAFPELDGDCEN